MKKNEDKAAVAASMVRAAVSPFIVILGGAFMLLMLLLLCIEIDMLKGYWRSERVYAASAETINPAHEGCLVRVTGPLCTNETLSAGNLGTYSDVIEIQNHATIAYADMLQLGKWQVQGLYTGGMTPFFYFAINTPGINWVNVGDTKLAMLPSGSEVTLVGRQRGNTLDMADPMSKANLGKPAAGFLNHVNDSPNSDISLHSYQGVAFFALLAYVGTWLLLAVAVRRPLWWGLATGAALLLLASLIIIVL